MFTSNIEIQIPGESKHLTKKMKAEDVYLIVKHERGAFKIPLNQYLKLSLITMIGQAPVSVGDWMKEFEVNNGSGKMDC